ncbi:MAG: nucleoside permease [Dysgonamonadaceae bacterium]|nr:nucleoside permease [Dysgonamonadaceae bacterium]MDD4729387.1 nucleoside permease [Dysgonamonadaceae bacterium]
MNLKLRLILMNFLQYAIWGAWLISLGAYLGGKLNFSGVQIGSFFATMGIASLFMPGLLGIVADRFIPAEKLLGVCHLLGATFLFLAAPQTEYAMLYTYILLAVFFYMPTIALSNAVAYNALEKAGYDTVKTFPPIRIWGTIGFIGSMIAVDLLRIDGMKFSLSAYQLYFAAVLSFILGVYSFTLPKCPTSTADESRSWVDNFGLRAFALFKKRKMAVFFTFSMLLGVALQITNMFANDYLTNYFGSMPEFQNTFGVQHANILISISQMSETLCILLIPFFLKRFGIKKVMLISMFAWILRFGLLGMGDPGGGVWMLVLSMIVYGVAFDFFNISGSLFVEQETSPKIRSSAQGLFMIMTNGFGAFFGSYAAGQVVDMVGWPNAWFVFTGYSAVVMVLFAILFKYKHDPMKIERQLAK